MPGVPEDMAPGAKRPVPNFTYTPWLSVGQAFLAATAISAALYARKRTGRGQHVEISLLQAALAMTTSKWMRVGNPDAPGFRSWLYDRRASKGFFRCADGRWIEHWVQNPRFVLSSSQGDRLAVDKSVDRVRDDPERITPEPENIVVLAHYFPVMAEAFARLPSDQWVEAARQAGVPLQPVRTPEEALSDPALLAERAVVEVDHPEHGPLRQVGLVYHLSRTPGEVRAGVCREWGNTTPSSGPRRQPCPGRRPQGYRRRGRERRAGRPPPASRWGSGPATEDRSRG